MLRTFLAPCLLAAASVLSLAGITAAHRLTSTPAGPPSCSRQAPPVARPTCP